jgi:D-alanyl-D-alanine carboxypeptidase
MNSMRFAFLKLALTALVVSFATVAVAKPYSAFVAEIDSERVLYQHNPDDLRHPASLTKMMTLYLVFESLANGRISLQDPLWASRFGTTRPPSKLGLRVGDAITVEEGILALVTQSANDAATTLAEGLAGSEERFAEIMTRKARQLGMRNTVFRNASGLPDPGQVTTARDMFRLGKALIQDFPRYYRYFSTESFQFGGRHFKNHNHLLGRYYGADGIKTGFIHASGFNLVASAQRNHHRLVGVVFGGNTAARRDAHMEEILDDGFAQLDGLPPKTYLATLEQMLPTAPQIRQSEEVATALLSEKYAVIGRAARERQARPGPTKSTSTSAWQIRLGEFPQQKAAELQLTQARRYTPTAFRQAKVAIASHSRGGKKMYAAYLKGISREEAQQACQILKRRGVECAMTPASS